MRAHRACECAPPPFRVPAQACGIQLARCGSVCGELLGRASVPAPTVFVCQPRACAHARGCAPALQGLGARCSPSATRPPALQAARARLPRTFGLRGRSPPEMGPRARPTQQW
eukprot:444857-Alexandrium_andersonii.AAC.1